MYFLVPVWSRENICLNKNIWMRENICKCWWYIIVICSVSTNLKAWNVTLSGLLLAKVWGIKVSHWSKPCTQSPLTNLKVNSVWTEILESIKSLFLTHHLEKGLVHFNVPLINIECIKSTNHQSCHICQIEINAKILQHTLTQIDFVKIDKKLGQSKTDIGQIDRIMSGGKLDILTSEFLLRVNSVCPPLFPVRLWSG